MLESRDQKFRIDFELKQIDKEVQIVDLLKTVMMSGSIDDIQLRAAAGTLHSIYNGIEKILLFKIKDQGIKIDTNEKWHTELLLKTMENGIISKKLAEELKQLMGFRHFFRHTYGFMLNKENIKPLVFNMRQLFEEFRSEIG